MTASEMIKIYLDNNEFVKDVDSGSKYPAKLGVMIGQYIGLYEQIEDVFKSKEGTRKREIQLEWLEGMFKIQKRQMEEAAEADWKPTHSPFYKIKNMSSIRSELNELGLYSYTPDEKRYIYSEDQAYLLTTNPAGDLYGKYVKYLESTDGETVKYAAEWSESDTANRKENNANFFLEEIPFLYI